MKLPWLPSNVKSVEEININISESLQRCIYNNNENNIILSDTKGNRLIKYNLNTHLSDDIQRDFIKEPFSLCQGNQNQIYIDSLKDILLLNDKMELIRKVNLSQFGFVYDMVSEMRNNKPVLYIAHYDDNKISIFDAETATIQQSLKVNTPLYLSLSQNYLVLISFTRFSIDEKTKKPKLYQVIIAFI